MRSLFLSLLLVSLIASAAKAAMIDYLRAPYKLWSPSSEYNITTLAPTLNVTEVAINCTSTIRQATLRANETHITLQGISADSNEACFAANVTSRPGSFIRAYTKKITRIRDYDNKLHRGKVCDLDVPGWSQIIYKQRDVDLTIPLTNTTEINCNNSNSPTDTPVPTTTTTHALKTTTTTTTLRHTTTTTTTHKPTPTEKPDDDNDDDRGSADWISGQVTFFTPNQGACGDWNDDDDMIVALGPDWYGNMNAVSKYCDEKVRITGPRGNSITVTVKDACPPCDSGHLDLSPAAFKKLGEFDTGILKVKWHFL
ncbi:RlpA-like double-psi beta-barrel-protein domain-containing protein-containing protein [Zychaea mexicana]|uniref:RlpA-like double-psi beta-barrel-protein domain-containing protein-containing protein n=1 Tax=Zychaea mexicana TaxID=64656 RepID=UPI0022FE1B71|nr:RlpA-like double-psi beta-barrel-protein domain-containing protein-containing protein [Zychaea mexicana]KAI9493564.1 RlpA-like double-psi beta-barrel-protein domain-containing protein-containing protein [Zychaea mexicana]